MGEPARVVQANARNVFSFYLNMNQSGGLHELEVNPRGSLSETFTSTARHGKVNCKAALSPRKECKLVVISEKHVISINMNCNNRALEKID